jgi:hypothetical protein
MKMRQSFADYERDFIKEVSLERQRRDLLRRRTYQRTLRREVDRRHRRGSMRFVLLVLALFLTAAAVTILMFRTIYLILA